MLKTLESKLEAYEFKLSDLELRNYYEASAPVNNNYGYMAVNYNTTQKKLLYRDYGLRWEKSVESLEEFLCSLRFNGYNGAIVEPCFDKKSEENYKKLLLEKAMAKAKTEAEIIASASGVSLGEIQKVEQVLTEPISYVAEVYRYGYNQNIFNNNGGFYVVGSDLTGVENSISLTVTYTIE